MNQSTNLFFIALLPSPEIQAYALQIQQYFADHYHSRAALKSPPHITLQSPFEWEDAEATILKQSLIRFANSHKSIPVTLNGFAAFPPRVIYINVAKTKEIMAVQNDLMVHMKNLLGIVDSVYKKRPFVPHLTVAFRDLTPENFQTGWKEFQHRKLLFEFPVTKLTLLMHDTKQWHVCSEFPFSVRST